MVLCRRSRSSGIREPCEGFSWELVQLGSRPRYSLWVDWSDMLRGFARYCHVRSHSTYVVDYRYLEVFVAMSTLNFFLKCGCKVD